MVAREMASSKPPAGTFKLLYFAAAMSFTKRDSDFLPAPQPLGQLFAVLEMKYPGIEHAVLSSSAITLNLEYVDVPESASEGQDIVINEGDEVAIIPPVSSG